MHLKRAKAAKNAYLFAFRYDGNVHDHLRTAMLLDAGVWILWLRRLHFSSFA